VLIDTNVGIAKHIP